MARAGDGANPRIRSIAASATERTPTRLGAARYRFVWMESTVALLGLAALSDSAYSASDERFAPRAGLPTSEEPQTQEEQRHSLLELLQRELSLQPPAIERLRAIFDRSRVLGQGNPAISVHAISRAQCEAQRTTQPLHPADDICEAPFMVAIYDPARERVDDARVCIDQFEFPAVPCQYPVVHIQANEAVEVCEALGKRLCDAHEWEGACAGALHSPDVEYAWQHTRAEIRALHNADREVLWAYGSERNHALCSTFAEKTPGCPGGGYERCGSNTAPTGSFPVCVSPFGVYDLHGNAAEHMNLPLAPNELGSAGGHGSTEMKGSWFVFGHIDAHPDDCRWRAPDWHGTRVTDPRSHANYHLGFRCCKDL